MLILLMKERVINSKRSRLVNHHLICKTAWLEGKTLVDDKTRNHRTNFSKVDKEQSG